MYWTETDNRFALLQAAALLTGPLLLTAGNLQAAGVERFLEPVAWQCTFQATMKREIREATGPGGMAHGPKRQLFQALEQTGLQAESPGGDTDSYYELVEQSVDGRIRLHYTYDGGLDGIQIAGWNNGGADVRAKSYFEGTEQNKTVFRDKTATFDGVAKFEGEEYEPPFSIWIYPEEGVYALEYWLPPVQARQVEHCRMAEGMEDDRQKAESATDADMPLGGFVSGLTKFTCATEKWTEVDLEGGAMSGLVENVPIPRSGLVLEGAGESEYIDGDGVELRWSCRPE